MSGNKRPGKSKDKGPQGLSAGSAAVIATLAAATAAAAVTRAEAARTKSVSTSGNATQPTLSPSDSQAMTFSHSIATNATVSPYDDIVPAPNAKDLKQMEEVKSKYEDLSQTLADSLQEITELQNITKTTRADNQRNRTKNNKKHNVELNQELVSVEQELARSETELRILQQACSNVIELIQIADSSGSQINSWNLNIQLQVAIIENVVVLPGSASAVIAFSNYVSIVSLSTNQQALVQGAESLPLQGGGTNMAPAITAAQAQLAASEGNDRSIPRVILIASDFVVDDPTNVRNAIASVVSLAASQGWTLRIALIAVAGASGINTDLVSSLAAQYPAIIQTFTYPDQPDSIQSAIRDVGKIAAAMCGPAPTNSPVTMMPSPNPTAAPTVKATVAPSPVPSVTPTDSPTNATGGTNNDAAAAAAALPLWLLINLGGVRWTRVPEEGAAASDVEAQAAVTSITKIEHTVGLDSAEKFETDGIGRHTERANVQNAFNVPILNTGLRMQDKRDDRFKKVPGHGNSSGEPNPPPPPPVPASEPDKKLIVLFAPLLVTLGKLFWVHVYGGKHNRALEVTPQELRDVALKGVAAAKERIVAAKERVAVLRAKLNDLRDTTHPTSGP